jgi:hypothetical protein
VDVAPVALVEVAVRLKVPIVGVVLGMTAFAPGWVKWLLLAGPAPQLGQEQREGPGWAVGRWRVHCLPLHWSQAA